MQMLPTSEFLSKRLGLVENPFSETQADDEDQLSKYFVDLPAFYKILDTDTGKPKSSILSASRGCGKSANRLNVERWLRQGPNKGFTGKWPWKIPTLVVLYNDFNRLKSSTNGDLLKIRPEDHVNSILWICVSSLLDYLEKNWEGNRISDSSSWLAAQLGYFLVNYTDKWKYFNPPDQPNDSVKYENIQDFSSFLTYACVESHKAEQLPAGGSTSLLQAFKNVAFAFGVKSIVVLVDGVDELDITANDPKMGAMLLKSLIAERTIMQLDGLYFKFFLPNQVVTELKKIPETRMGERINAYEMVWDEDLIQTLLSERLKVYSKGVLLDLGQLASPEVANVGQILAVSAYNNPRNLLRLCNWLLRHLEKNYSKSQIGVRNHKPRITKSIIEAAIASFEKEIDEKAAYTTTKDVVNDKESFLITVSEWDITSDLRVFYKGILVHPEKLDPKEFEILAYLLGHAGQLVRREELGQAVWKDKWVSKYDWVLTQTMSRLRKKIGGNRIETIRGMGYIFHIKQDR